jgi:hypothetical protein
MIFAVPQRGGEKPKMRSDTGELKRASGFCFRKAMLRSVSVARPKPQGLGAVAGVGAGGDAKPGVVGTGGRAPEAGEGVSSLKSVSRITRRKWVRVLSGPLT